MFEYFTTVVSYRELQPLLTARGRDEWRLHTCEPLPGVHGTSEAVFVVMDRVGQAPAERERISTPHGMGMT